MHLLDDFRIEELTSTELYKLIIELQEDSIKTKELLLNVSKELLLAKKEIKTQNIEIEIIKKRQSNRQKQKPIANFSGNSAFEKKNKGQYNIETDLIDDGFDDDDDLFDDSFNDGFDDLFDDSFNDGFDDDDDLFDDSFNDDFNEPLDLSFAARSKFKSQGYKAVDEEIKKMSQDIDKEIKKMNQDIDQEFKKMSQNVNEEFKKMNQDIDQEFKKMSQDVAKEIDDLFKN